MLNVYEESEIKEHFSEITDEIIEYATNVALSFSKYIFVSSGRFKKAYCTHCNKHFRFDHEGRIKQNMKHTCPECKSECTLKKSWVGRKYMRDLARFLWFEKSQLNPNMVVASWVYCSRDYRGSYEETETVCSRETLYLFEIGNPKMYEVWHWHDHGLEQRNTIFDPISHLRTRIATHKLNEAVQGTQYQYSGWQHYHPHELIKYLALFSQTPNIEVLTKSGFKNIVRIKMESRKTHRSINWKAKRLHEFFKVSKNDFKEMMRVANIDTMAGDIYTLKGRHATSVLYLWQCIRKNKEKIKYEDALSLVKDFRISDNARGFNNIRKCSSIVKMSNYIKKQIELGYMGRGQLLITWSDYLDDCIRLEMDVKDQSIVYPKNLYEAHQRTIELVKVQKDEIINQKIKNREEGLERLKLESGNLFIRPPHDFDEIITEGKKLKHCVATYAERHAINKTTLLFIRKKNRPNTPFYTVELQNNRIHQVRGYKNKDATEAVNVFVDVFKDKKLKNRKVRNVV